MRLTTWNVNGLRARLTHVIDFLREQKPDVLCLQETKVQDEQFPRSEIEDEGYNVECFGQKSYNGVAILSQRPIEAVLRGLPDDPPGAEARVLGATIGDLMVLNLYVPNGQGVGTDKYRFKLDWLRRLRALLDARYDTKEQLALVGDFNVALADRDVHDPKAWHEQILCSTPEREALQQVLSFGLDDALRLHHQQAGIHTWWDYRTGAAERGAGLRIDYVFTSKPASRRCRDVVVHQDYRRRPQPSDHAPVSALFVDQDPA